MTRPEVSVVMGVRDDAEGLEIAARSVLAQREVELELVVVDDGSADATRGRLAELAATDSRIRPIRTAAQGLTRALMTGCADARAPWIARQDAGDSSDPERLRAQLDLIQAHPDVALVSCWTLCQGPEGEDLQLVTGRRPDAAPVDLDPSDDGSPESIGPSSHGSALFRRSTYEAAGGYRPEFALAQDCDLWWRLGERGRFAAVPRDLYRRTLSPTSLSFRLRSTQQRMGELARSAALARRRGEPETEILRQAARLSALPQPPGSPARTEALGFYFIGALLHTRRDPRAARYFREAWRRDPLLLRAWVRWAVSRP